MSRKATASGEFVGDLTPYVYDAKSTQQLYTFNLAAGLQDGLAERFHKQFAVQHKA